MNKHLNPLKKAKGFTLIEVMVVVVILAILATYVVPKIMSRPGEARINKAKSDIKAIGNALELYRLDNFSYPTTDQGLNALVEKPTTDPIPKNWQDKGYLDKDPVDPWGNPYQYLSPGETGDYDLFTLGRDNREGGEGEDQDISSIELK